MADNVSQVTNSIMIDRNVGGYEKLALRIVQSAIEDLDSPNHAEQLIALDWLIDEGCVICDILPGDWGEFQVLAWLVSRFPESVCERMLELLNERMNDGR